MNNQIQDGNVLPLIAPYDVTSGDGFLVGGIFAIAAFTALEDEEVEGARFGVYSINKKSGDDVTLGLALYWDDTEKEVTITSTDNKFIGYAAEAAAGSATSVNVCLVPN